MNLDDVHVLGVVGGRENEATPPIDEELRPAGGQQEGAARPGIEARVGPRVTGI